MPTTQTLLTGLEGFRAARERILKDGDLSEEAKKRRVKELREQAIASITQTGDLLWRGMESDLRSAEAAIRQARQQASAGWDFQRLAYEAGAMPSLLAWARSLSDVEKTYEQIKATGDPYKLRAFREYVPGLIASRNYPASDGVGSLVQTLKRDAEEAMTTPALKRAEASAGELVQRILEAKKATGDVINEFGLNQSFSSPSTLNPIVQWLRRLKIKTETLPNDPFKQIITVDFAPAESVGPRQFVDENQMKFSK